jgi:diguanylate cyclase (GGDEF)-like protein
MLELDCSDCHKPITGEIRTLQHLVLERLARDEPLTSVMEELCRRAERLAPEVVCSVLSIDQQGRMHPIAAPGLPKDLTQAMDNYPIGPDVGSCGAAAFLGEPVEAWDIASDPRWAPYKELFLPLGLRACWSSPIHAAGGRVIGTFAFYYRTCRGASPVDRAIVAACVDLCAIALEQEERKAAIHRLAYFDAVTGAANRASLELHGRLAVDAAVESGMGAAVFCIDLDNFKEVNDTLGHRAGDALLKACTARISAMLHPGEFLARIGGDEFAVVQPCGGTVAEAEELAARIVKALDAPLAFEGASLTIGVSVGVARAPQDGRDLGELMKKADFALYEVKANGRGHFRLYDADMHSQIAANRRITRELAEASARKEFALHFQPIVDLCGGTITGFEALLRWRHQRDGLLAPSHFLHVAEKAGFINEIGRWVLQEACALAAGLPESMRVCVNLSPSQLEQPGFAIDVANALAASGLSPRRLELEIVESSLLLENAVTLACLNQIKGMGVSIALDDFGTGYSALSYLRAFPADRIKIDKSFVQEAVTRPETESIVRTIIGLAHDLNMKTTGEGVETEAQLRMLRRCGCDEIQGFLVSLPRPLETFLAEPVGAAAPKLRLTLPDPPLRDRF